MRPTKTLLILFLILFFIGLGACFMEFFKLVCILFGAVILVIAVVDALFTLNKPRLHFKRHYQERYALGEATEVQATLMNRGKSKKTVRMYDGVPDYCEHEELPFKKTLKAGEFAKVGAVLTFTRRGDHEISPAYCEYHSSLGLWWRKVRIGKGLAVKVFPNYVPALNYGLLATSDRLAQMGIVKKRLKGLSKEFHQLRDYHDGDPLNQIDWKATSRVERLISREFQVERDQNILLVADCSIRTKALDHHLPILDHILNSMILISYMALKQGDKVSLMNFGIPPSEHRYLAPVKGNSGIPKILNHLYNYQSTKSYGEYSALAKRILSQSRKRSFVIILTNLRSEDQYGCVEALRLLSQKHTVLLASVQETSVSEALKKPIYTTSDANLFLGAEAYEQDAEKLVADLSAAGVSVLRSPVEGFGVALANRYLDLRDRISA